MKTENLQVLMKCFLNEGLAMFDKEMEVFFIKYKMGGREAGVHHLVSG